MVTPDVLYRGVTGTGIVMSVAADRDASIGAPEHCGYWGLAHDDARIRCAVG